MAKEYYLPKADSDKVVWLKNFVTKFSPIAANFGFEAEEAANINKDSLMFEYTVNLVDLYKEELKERTAFKNIMRDGQTGTPVSMPTAPAVLPVPDMVDCGIFNRLKKTVARIKAHPAYNESIGYDLGIIGSDYIVDEAALKPIIQAENKAGNVIIKWTKNRTTGIDIYVDRGGGKFEFLATDTEPDYIDTFNLEAEQPSALWRYKAIYKMGDESVGEFSDEVTVAVKSEI